MPDIFDQSTADANSSGTISTAAVFQGQSDSGFHRSMKPQADSTKDQPTQHQTVPDQTYSVSSAKIRHKYQVPQEPKTTKLHQQAITSAKDLRQKTNPIDATAADDQPKNHYQTAAAKPNPPLPTHQAEMMQEELVKPVDAYSEVMRQEKPTQSRFRAYVPKPVDVHFASQNSKEQIILILRQHPITQLKNALIALGMVLGYFFVAWLGLFSFLPGSYLVGITLFWFLIVIGYSFGTFLKWLYNMYIITDERIIDVDVYNLMKRNMTSAKIDHIQDVTAANYGILGSIFDVGIVVVQTAGAHPMLEFGGVPHPARVVTLINELVLEEEREKLEGRVM